MTTRSDRTFNLERVRAAWHGLTKHVPLGPMLTEADYAQRVQMLDTLLDAIGTNETHPLGDLLDLLATQIEAYERQQPTMPEATPLEVLRYLMEEHGLTQTDLAEDLGGQSPGGRLPPLWRPPGAAPESPDGRPVYRLQRLSRLCFFRTARPACADPQHRGRPGRSHAGDPGGPGPDGGPAAARPGPGRGPAPGRGRAGDAGPHRAAAHCPGP